MPGSSTLDPVDHRETLMDRMIYVAMSGAQESMLGLSTTANNMANANTTGFLEDLNQFRSMPVYGPGYASRVHSMSERSGVNLERGPLLNTGRKLDVAIDGDGWIAVQGKDGKESYTRRGDLTISPEGLLSTGKGLPVIGNQGPIVLPDSENIDIAKDGRITVRPRGSDVNALLEIDRIKLVNPPLEEMQKGVDGEMRLKSGQLADADANVAMEPGFLEGSNVKIVDSLVKMIELSRRFEMQIKVMKTADDVEKASTSVMSLG